MENRFTYLKIQQGTYISITKLNKSTFQAFVKHSHIFIIALKSKVCVAYFSLGFPSS